MKLLYAISLGLQILVFARPQDNEISEDLMNSGESEGVDLMSMEIDETNANNYENYSENPANDSSDSQTELKKEPENQSSNGELENLDNTLVESEDTGLNLGMLNDIGKEVKGSKKGKSSTD